MNRGYLHFGERRVHVLAAGRGPAVLLLQDVPLRALDLRPLGDELARSHAVIAVDLAGCGLTDPLAGPVSLDALVADVIATVNALGLRTLSVYARGTASAIALRLQAALGVRVSRVVLDDPRLVTAADADAWRCWYDDAFMPEPSGAHLVRLWDRVRIECQFRPPYRQTAATRIVADMPAADVLTRRVLGWLCAGTNAPAVFRALAAEPVAGSDDRSRVRTLPEPTTFAAAASAAGALRAALDGLEPSDSVDLRHWRAPPAAGSGLARTFVPVARGDLHGYVSRAGAGRPVVVLHDPAGTSELVLSFGAPLAADRPVIALDLPGNGESDDTLGTADPTSATYAAAVAEALDALGVDEVDLIGRYSGGPVGMELAFMQPGRVRHLVQAGITVYAPDEARRLLERYTPTIAPESAGSHLLLAWHIMKSQALYWPWFDQTRDGVIRGEPQLEPRLIHRRVVDLLKCGDLYRKAYAALWTYPLEERLPRLDVPTLLCAPPWDPLYPHLGKAAAAGPQCRVVTLPPRFEDWQREFVPFLDDLASAPLHEATA